MSWYNKEPKPKREKRPIWNDQSTGKSKIVKWFISLPFILIFLYILFTPYVYSEFCKNTQFHFKEDSGDYTLKEQISATLCPSKPINLYSIKEINEEVTKQWSSEIVLFYIKFNLLLVFAFIIFYTWRDELREDLRDKYNDVFLFSFSMWNWMFGGLTFTWFVMGWF